MSAPKKPITEWGKALRRWREEANMKQEELAAASGIRQNVISSIEIGPGVPEIPTWNKLMSALGRTVVSPWCCSPSPKIPNLAHVMKVPEKEAPK